MSPGIGLKDPKGKKGGKVVFEGGKNSGKEALASN